MKSGIYEFYTAQSIYTDQHGYADLFLAAGNDIEHIFCFIKKLLIHPVDAKASGIKMNMREELRRHVFSCTVTDIMNHPKIAALIEENRFATDTLPEERAILSCDHAALLCASVLREKNIPVRTRAGFAKYIVEGAYLPHWICEVYLNDKTGWTFIDPERGLMSLEDGSFVTAGYLWLQARGGNFNPTGIRVGNYSAHDALKYELLNDINCIMKQELLNYGWMITGPPKKPDLFRVHCDRLSEDELELLDSLALISSSDSFNIDVVTALYEQYISPENLR